MQLWPVLHRKAFGIMTEVKIFPMIARNVEVAVNALIFIDILGRYNLGCVRNHR
jgi:hypothetical protein